MWETFCTEQIGNFSKQYIVLIRYKSSSTLSRILVDLRNNTLTLIYLPTVSHILMSNQNGAEPWKNV